MAFVGILLLFLIGLAAVVCSLRDSSNREAVRWRPERSELRPAEAPTGVTQVRYSMWSTGPPGRVSASPGCGCRLWNGLPVALEAELNDRNRSGFHYVFGAARWYGPTLFRRAEWPRSTRYWAGSV